MRRTAVPRRRARRVARDATFERAAITTVVVTVPARNEAASIRACLRSIDGAARGVDLRTVVVVAADRCCDATVSVARRTAVAHVELVVLDGGWRSVGATRAAGIAAGLARPGVAAASTWLANTDADCTVPADWLAGQLRLASDGIDAVAGVVALDATAPRRLQQLFVERYATGLDAHGHVHGANFGVRFVAYDDVGGWLARTVVGEEHDLLRRLERRGWLVGRPVHPAVSTSPRRAGRVAGGFATWLARLDPSGAALEGRRRTAPVVGGVGHRFGTGQRG